MTDKLKEDAEALTETLFTDGRGVKYSQLRLADLGVKEAGPSGWGKIAIQPKLEAFAREQIATVLSEIIAMAEASDPDGDHVPLWNIIQAIAEEWGIEL